MQVLDLSQTTGNEVEISTVMMSAFGKNGGAIILVLVLVLGAKVENARAVEWSVCRHGAMNVTNLELLPDPIQAGVPANFRLFTDHDVDVESGNLKASVNYMGIPVFKKTGDLCKSPVLCPLSPGENILNLIENMPGFLPPGRMVLTLHATRPDGLDLFCVDVFLQGKKSNRNGPFGGLKAMLGMPAGTV